MQSGRDTLADIFLTNLEAVNPAWIVNEEQGVNDLEQFRSRGTEQGELGHPTENPDCLIVVVTIGTHLAGFKDGLHLFADQWGLKIASLQGGFAQQANENLLTPTLSFWKLEAQQQQVFKTLQWGSKAQAFHDERF